MTPTINLYNIDCMELLAKTPDKFYGLSIVDPPYGIGESKRHSYHPNATTTYKQKKWDNNVPDDFYFSELFRVSVNQIIWGGNYFNLPPQPKWIVWDKQQPEGIDQAMFELAWQSQKNIQSKIFVRSPSQDKNCVSNGDSRARQTKKRIHPTQKPVALYKWLLKNYAKPGDKILDTHGGSLSHAIACFDLGFDLDICELDHDYFKAGKERFDRHTRQGQLFTPEGKPKIEVQQLSII